MILPSWSKAQVLALNFTVEFENSVKGEGHAEMAHRPTTIEILEQAKTDHLNWQSRLTNALNDKESIQREELTTQHTCALGNWYAQVDVSERQKPGFMRLTVPHEVFHTALREAVEASLHGDKVKAKREGKIVRRQVEKVIRIINHILRHEGR